MPKVILDAGHGGSDVGESYESRSEKNDNLLLALQIGQFLKARGIEVEYTRTEDVYLPMLDRVAIANQLGGDLLISIHRLSGININSSPGLDFFIGEDDSYGEKAARNIGQMLQRSGYENYGIIARTDIPLINDTDMPAIMTGLGYIRSENDNKNYDNNFVQMAEDIAEGIYLTLFDAEETVRAWDNHKSIYHYRVVTGPYRNYDSAVEKQLILNRLGYVTELVKSLNQYFIYTQSYTCLDIAAGIELQLRLCSCNTCIIKL